MFKSYTLHLQVPPPKVFGPSKPTPNTFSKGTWRPRDIYQTPLRVPTQAFVDFTCCRWFSDCGERKRAREAAGGSTAGNRSQCLLLEWMETGDSGSPHLKDV